MSNMPTLIHPSQLPSVDALLQQQSFIQLIHDFGRDPVKQTLQQQLKATRQLLVENLKSSAPGNKPLEDSKNSITDYLHQQITETLSTEFDTSLKSVFNLTGTILHTNLGRAPYPQPAIDAMVDISQGACNLEFDLKSGVRGRRDDHVEKWICKLTGAEAATTVNNNAAAVLLTLNSIAAGRNVIVSRGELIEIGGSFRVPAIMEKAGCKLREVGTTNRTHQHDYKNAIGKKTAALMKVHTSNYQINGFTKEVSATELSALANEHDIPLIDDMGSGTLIDVTQFGLPYERTAQDALNDGADLITFSGDKLLGGPQCGIIAGRADLVKRIEKNPMKRAMRLDKVTLAALEAVLKLYLKPETLVANVPSLQAMGRSLTEIMHSADVLKEALQQALPEHQISVVESQCQIGSGALPTNTLDSCAVVIHGNEGHSIHRLSEALRALPKPVIGRVSQNAFWLDCRMLRPQELTELTQLINSELAARL